jgi:ABC-2 type transport system permease protein
VSTATDTTRATVSLAPPERPATVVTTGLQVAARTVRKYLRTPQLVVLSTVTGAMWLLIFRYVFGGAIQAGPVPYVDYLVPSFVFGMGVLFQGMNASVGVAEDVEHGFFDRLRSLPVGRIALLGGRSVADTALVAWGLAVTTAIGFLVGFRIHGDVSEALAALGLALVYGFAFTWVFIYIGLAAGTAQAAQGMSLLVFLLWFVSSAFVPIQSMPGWLQAVANNQPITMMVNSVRSLTLGDPALAGLAESTAHYVGLSLIWSAGLVLVFAPLAVARYRRS